jgi:hypothetical protein
MKQYDLDPEHFAFKPFVSNETTMDAAQRNLLKNIEGAKQGALNKGDEMMVNIYNDLIAKNKANAFGDYKFKPYKSSPVMNQADLNYAESTLSNPDDVSESLLDKLHALDELTDKNKLEAIGHKATEQAFNDWHAQKQLDLETPEGQRRIQKFIDDNYVPDHEWPGLDPSFFKPTIRDYMNKFKTMKYNDKTKPYVESINTDIQKLNNYTDRLTNLEKDYANALSNPSSSLDDLDLLDAELTMLKFNKDELTGKIVDDIQKVETIDKGASFAYDNSIFIGKNYQTPQDLQNTLDHEGNHGLTAPTLMNFVNSKMDQDLIKELKLTEKLPEHLKQNLSIETIKNTPKNVATQIGIDKGYDPENYWKSAKKYWEQGNTNILGNSKEPTSFLAEVRSSMKQDGLIKNNLDPITADMLKDYYLNYISQPVHHKDLRVFDIMENKKSNFKVLEKHINDLLGLAPYLVPTAIGAGAVGATALPQEKDGGIYLELDDDEIQAYKDGGYIVEDLD